MDPSERRVMLTEALKRLDGLIFERKWSGVAEEARYCRALLVQLEDAAEREQARANMMRSI